MRLPRPDKSGLAMTRGEGLRMALLFCHCEERSDEAISWWGKRLPRPKIPDLIGDGARNEERCGQSSGRLYIECGGIWCRC